MCFRKLFKFKKMQEKKENNHLSVDVNKNEDINREANVSKDIDVIKNTEINEDIDKAKGKYFSRVIAVANQKGGVGKSTTAVNMSSYLGDLGYKTLLIDLDPQSNSTSGLGITREKIDKNIYDILISNEEPRNAILKTQFSNLYIIPSSIQLAGAEVELVSTLKREYKLQHTIEKIKHDFDFIIIDCPPALGLLTINALTGAAEVLIPIQCEYYALEGLGQLINTINLVRENLNENLIIAGVVMTMYDQRTKLSEQVIDEVKTYFPDKVYNTIIPRNIRLSEAPSYGKPILEYDPACKGAIAYKNLTKEVIGDGK
jgi:chromosome partitioning protein